jgi:chondroitin AC lyase
VSRHLCLIMLSLPLIVAGPRAAVADDLGTVETRFVDHVLDTRSGSSSHLATQRSDGSWADVDYSDTSKANWDLYKHVDRVLAMAVAYREGGSTSTSLKTGIEKGLAYWNSVNPGTPNAYDRAIGAPIKLGEILVLTKGKISTTVRDGTLDYIDHVVLSNGYSRYGSGGGLETGADVARAAYVHMTIGLTKGTGTDIATASTRIQGQAKTVKQGDEGLQADGGYHYHGPQLYSPWYAQTHYEGTSLWSRILTQTQWQFSSNANGFLRKGTLDGMQWMTRRGQWDPFVTGRAIAIKNVQDVNIPWVSDLKSSDPQYASQYQAFIDHNNGTNNGSVVGNKHFWNSDYMSHRREGFMLSVRMVSNRTYVQEAGNDQNVRGLWLSHGTTAIMVDGDEYNDIQPVWDWKRIPGTTASSTSKLKGPDWGVARNKKAFVGGASDGDNGVAAMDMRMVEFARSGKTPPELLAKKSWFFFGDVMIALGSGITYVKGSDPEQPQWEKMPPVVTTLNQTIRDGSVISSTNSVKTTQSATAAGGADRSIAGAEWVWHDKVGYVFLGSQQVQFKNENNVTGDWSGISPGSYSSGDTVTKNRFTLSINHGDPTNASYAYMVVPGKSQSQFEQYYADMDIEVVSNTSALAAVRDHRQKMAGAVFFDYTTTNTVELRDGLAVQVNQNLILMADESGANPLFTLSSASGKAATAEDFGILTIFSPDVQDILVGNSVLTPLARGADWIRFDLPTGVSQFSLDMVPEPASAALGALAAACTLLRRRGSQHSHHSACKESRA